MSGTRTEQEIKHTPLDEAKIQADLKITQRYYGGQKVEDLPSRKCLADHIDDLLDDRARTRRLLEAGERLAIRTKQILDHWQRWHCPGDHNLRNLGSELAAYEEAAK